MDLLEIEITQLFKKNGTEICQDFTDSLLEIIQQNALEKMICENFSKILKVRKYICIKTLTFPSPLPLLSAYTI